MNKNLIIVVAGGFLIAILVALIVQAGLSGKKKQTVAQVKEDARVAILVASAEMPVGTKISDTNTKWQDWPKSGVFPGAVVREGAQKQSEAVSGKVSRALVVGEPVTESALVSDSLLSANLGEGMRAVAIDISAVKSAGGFIGPGDYVDILLTYRQTIRYDGPDNQQIDDMIKFNINRSATETIMQNVKVLAVDQAPVRNEEKGVKVGKTVTLEVDLRGAETLAVARTMGELSLVLRPLGDDKYYVRDYPVTTDARVTNVLDEIYKEIERIQNSPSQQSNIVRIYNGSSVGEVTISP